MKIQNIFFSNQNKISTIKINDQISRLPFYVKECGFLNERSFSRGESHIYTDYLILYTLSNMTFNKYGIDYPIRANDIVLSSCNTTLHFKSSKKKKQEFFYMIIGGKHAQQFYNLVRTTNYIYHTNSQDQLIESFKSIVAIDYTKDPVLSQLKAGSVIYELFQKLYQLNRGMLDARAASPAQKSAVQSAISYIESNYQKNLDIDTICTNIGFSKYYFCKLFKEHTGVTVHQYVTEFRINKAKDLLTYSELTITTIATSIGYKNSLTFTRSFKNLVHMTPSEYREKY